RRQRQGRQRRGPALPGRHRRRAGGRGLPRPGRLRQDHRGRPAARRESRRGAGGGGATRGGSELTQPWGGTFSRQASPPPESTPRRSPGVALIVLLLKALWVAFVIATPLLGAWAASSLAAYSNGPVAMAAATGLLLFPGLPLAWEGWAAYRRRRRNDTRPH